MGNRSELTLEPGSVAPLNACWRLRGTFPFAPRRFDFISAVGTGHGPISDDRTHTAFKTVRFAIPKFIPQSAGKIRLLGLRRADA